MLEGECVVNRADEPTSLRLCGGGVRTQLLTARFMADMPVGKALVAGLPSAIVSRAGMAACARIAPALALVRGETARPGGVSSAVLRRAAELLFIQALPQALLDTSPATGWLAAASDPRLAAALTAMHRQPDAQWTIAALARLSHLSRTTFFQRFCARMAQTPADYPQWRRLRIAAQRLQETHDSIGNMARAVGYSHPSAFACALRRAQGLAPNEFRSVRAHP